MIGFCVVFAIGIGYIAYRGANASTGVNLAVNIVQISALLVFAVIAVGYRANHPDGSNGWTLDPDGTPTKYALATFAVGADGNVGTFKAESDGTVNQYVTEVGDDGNSKKDDKDGNYIFKKDDKGNLDSRPDLQGRDRREGRPESGQGRQLGLRQEGRQERPGRHLQDGSGRQGQRQEGRRRQPDLREGQGRQVHRGPEGGEPPLRPAGPPTTRSYFPDEKGVYVVDNSGAGKPLALTDADKPKEKAETNYYLAVDDKGQPIRDGQGPRRRRCSSWITSPRC